MTIANIHMSSIADTINKCSVVKRKRERAVMQGSGLFYKIWVPEWTQGNITKHCFDVGFYHAGNTSSVLALIHDNTGQRGYIQKRGELVQVPNDPKSWKQFVELTNKDERFNFILDIMKRSIDVDGTYSDFAPSNVIMYEGAPNLIDLESFRSFDMVFDGNKSTFELFDLDAWWKPRETALRDISIYFKTYCKECLGIEIDFDISNREMYYKMYEIVKIAKETVTSGKV